VYSKKRRITYIALRSASALESVPDRLRVLTPSAAEMLARMRRILERDAWHPEQVLVTHALRSQQTATGLVPNTPYHVLRYGYPGIPNVSTTTAHAIRINYEIAVRTFHTTTLSWANRLSCSCSAALTQWLTLVRAELSTILSARNDGDVILAIGHGPSLMVALDTAPLAYNGYAPPPLHGILYTLEIDRSGIRVIHHQYMRP
jgi:hypothetical protein